MVTYCGKNTFEGNESNFNFQYYLPEDLIWLKNIIENNTSKRIFVFSHYFLPNKAGGGNKYVPGASTELMGITFHFLNKLNNAHKNVTWFSGHSHFSWMDDSTKGLHWTNKNYDYIKPTAQDNSTILTNYSNYYYRVTTGNKPYNRNSAQLADNNNTGWNIHLPSMSRPKTDNSQMKDCEAAIMMVYEDRVIIKKLGYTRNSNGTYTSYTNSIPDNTLTIYNNGTGECNDTAPEINETPSELNANQIKLVITNNLNENAIFTGYLRMQINGASKDMCFRNSQYYPITGNNGYYLYGPDSNGNRVKVVGYKHGVNTDRLTPGESMSIIYTNSMECHTTSQVSPSGTISSLFGKRFTQSTGVDSGAIKLAVAIDRNVDNPSRVDNYPNYYALRYTDANGNVLSSDPQITSGGTYYLSIYAKRTLYNKNWKIIPYEHYTSSDTINTAYVTVQ